MLRVCTLMNRVEDHYPELEQSCLDRDIMLYSSVRTGSWSWLNKVLWQLDWCERYPGDTFVFIDSSDVLCVGERDELEEAANEYDLLFQTDKNIGDGPWPLRDSDNGEWDKRRIKRTPWNYLNGSGPVGKGCYIAQAIKWQLKVEQFFEPGTDQLFWQRCYLSGFGCLDQETKIAVPLWGIEHGVDLGIKDGRVLNLKTGTKPQFIHATGRTWAWIPEELKPDVKSL